MRIIDIHTHAFPDSLADKAMPILEKEGNVKAALDGKVSSLRASMAEAGVERSVVASIATKPDQFAPILKWSKAIASDDLIPFPSVHPKAPQAVEQVREIQAEGFRGLKMHPYYQNFDLDDESLFPLYEAIQDCGLALLIHTGFDMAFPLVRKADPLRILRIVNKFPDLNFIATHMGAWKDWDEVSRHILGKRVYMDVSYSLPFMPEEDARNMLLAHPADCILFGSDSPWEDQKAAIDAIMRLDLGPERESMLLGGNACRLLGLPAE